MAVLCGDRRWQTLMNLEHLEPQSDRTPSNNIEQLLSAHNPLISIFTGSYWFMVHGGTKYGKLMRMHCTWYIDIRSPASTMWVSRLDLDTNDSFRKVIHQPFTSFYFLVAAKSGWRGCFAFKYFALTHFKQPKLATDQGCTRSRSPFTSWHLARTCTWHFHAMLTLCVPRGTWN